MNHKAKAIELLNIGHKCEVCGQPVKIYSGDEETNHYEGLAIDVVVGLLEKISELEKNYKEGREACEKIKSHPDWKWGEKSYPSPHERTIVAGCQKAVRELQSELQTSKQKYQELKGKLTVDNVKRLTCLLGYPNPPIDCHFDSLICAKFYECRYKAQALIKGLKATNDK